MGLKELRKCLEDLQRVIGATINEIDLARGRPPKNVSANGVVFVEDQYCDICDTLRGIQGACPHQLRQDQLKNEADLLRAQAERV